RRTGPARPGRGARALWGRAAAGARFHRAARRPVGRAPPRSPRRAAGGGCAPWDGLPGARGVGPKGAAALLHKYPTLEDALADGQLASQAEQLRIYRRIAAMDPAAPVPAPDDQTPTWDRSAALARGWELGRLATR